MEFHTCKNCCLIDQVISNQVKKYDTLSEENVGLHNALIKSRDTITEMGTEIANLRDGLIAERQRNIQMYLQQQTNVAQHGSQASMNIIVNPEPEELHRNKLKKCYSRVVSASTKEKNDFVPASKYNDLMSLLEKQKQMYEADLSLFQSLSDKCITKLKEQLVNMREHTSVMLEMYEVLRNDLFKEKKENIEFRKLLQDAIDMMQHANAKQIDDIKKKMMAEATHAANANVREAVSVMKIQLEDRDKLVTRLRHQQVKIEAYVEKQEQEIYNQQQDHKQATDELKKQLMTAKRRYSVLNMRRSLEAEGFRTDVTNIRKDIKKIQNELYTKGNKGRSYPDIQSLAEQVDKVDKHVQLCYYK